MAVTGTFTVCSSMCVDKLDKSEFSLTSPNYFATSPLRVVICKDFFPLNLAIAIAIWSFISKCIILFRE